MRLGGLLQRLLHRPAGGVVDMHDPPVRMPALAREVQRIAVLSEGHAQLLQALDRCGRILHHELDDLAVVEPRARDHRVLDMVLERVARLQHRGDPALRPGGRAFVERTLGQHGDLEAIGEVQRGGEAGGTRTDDKNVRAGHARPWGERIIAAAWHEARVSAISGW